jgi:hypothetical protein
MVLSKDLSLFVNNLQGNWGFIEKFLNEPKSLLQRFNLGADEKEAFFYRLHIQSTPYNIILFFFFGSFLKLIRNFLD